FTISLHLRALRDAVPASRAPRAASTHAGLTPLLVGMALGLAPTSAVVAGLLGSTPLSGLVSFDAIYRVFMACYGLVFPGLLWAWSASRRDDRPTTLLAAIGIVLAAPFFWLGFLEGRWIWLPVGLLLVLLAGALPMVLP